MGTVIYILAFALLLFGIYALVAKKNIVRIILGICILGYAVNLLLVLVGYRRDGVAPILAQGQSSVELAKQAVDPLPQAMVLTSIVIGLSTTALAVALAIRLYEKYGTFDMNDIRNLRG
ncbi:MAG: sodium:proton antiporter [Planctomycetota bacterium]|nr:sodium:proton antiporter [Planctomycetota bacterium]